MIIFDLDGTLADCEHRRHFVDSSKNSHVKHGIPAGINPGINIMRDYDVTTGEIWKPDWKAFYESCDNDKVISQTRSIFDFIGMKGQAHNLQIWSGRCESVREKTEKWLKDYSFAYALHHFDIELKMRPIGDNTPDDQLKEKWLDETISEGKQIHFVFDDRPKVIRMWRRRGIFVFNCCQHEGEF